MCKHQSQIKKRCDCHHISFEKNSKHIEQRGAWRRFRSSEEKIQKLKNYKKELERELTAVNEEINKLQKQ